MFPDPASGWALAIHGGAGVVTRGMFAPPREAAVRDALRQALATGGTVLAGGGSALDAVEAAVRTLEDSPHFNAGRGAVLTAEGRIELDAAIMDGRARQAGAVAQVTGARNPVTLARKVMEQTPHVLLAGAGADAFGRHAGIEQADRDWFELPERRAQLDELLAAGGDAYDVDMKYGTVGAVARDMAGHLAAATSTGGVTGKRWGRIGDTPAIGAGTWADDRAAAISCTGSGEQFVRAGAARAAAEAIRLLRHPAEAAVAAAIDDVRSLGGTGGMILMPLTGAPVWRFTTPGMYRGRVTAGEEPLVALFGDEA